MTATNAEYDIVIVGLGPVGAVAANLAGAAGFRTLVIEKAEQPYVKPRAIVFDAEIMRIFDSVGLADTIANVTRPLGGSVYLGADRQPIRTFRAPAPAHGQAWFASNLFYQPELEQILRDGMARYPNVEVRLGCEVRAVEMADNHSVVTIELPDGAQQRVKTDYVLACDGASSAVRKALNIPLDDIGFEERWLVVDTFVDGPMEWPDDYGIPDEVRDGRYSLMVCEPSRPATLIPGVGRHRRWEYMLLPGEHPDDVIPEDWLRDQLAQWVDPANVEIVRSAVYRFRALVAREWRRQRVFLLGDAAHQTPPFFGQGMCHGIRDAAQLVWRLELVRAGKASGAVFDSYQAEREPHVREIIAASVAAGAAVCKLDPAEAVARDADFRAQEAARAGRPAAMTDVVPPLRAGIIDVENAGMRLPDFALVRPDGSTQKLDDLLAGEFALLSLDMPQTVAIACGLLLRQISVSSESGSTLRDAGALAAWLREHGARYVIVRPDRYVHSFATSAAFLGDKLELLGRQLGLETTLAQPAQHHRETIAS